MGFGGPVWHASGKAATAPVAWALAERALRGVGDADLGEWREVGGEDEVGVVCHLRRRLATWEQRRYRLEVRDVRDTAEHARRIARVIREAPHLAAYVALESRLRSPDERG